MARRTPAPEASDESVLRRRPRQERSRRRVEALLDAAAQVFAEAGFEAATTEAIAARAGTSIGSLYQFFPSKTALFVALAERCLERSRALVGGLLQAWPAGRPWTELLDAAVDGLFAQHRADPGVRALMQNLHLYGSFAAADRALTEELTAQVQRLFLRLSPALPRARAAMLAAMVVSVVSSLLVLCEREEPRRARRMMNETKLLLRRYLEGDLGPA